MIKVSLVAGFDLEQQADLNNGRQRSIATRKAKVGASTSYLRILKKVEKRAERYLGLREAIQL